MNRSPDENVSQTPASSEDAGVRSGEPAASGIPPSDASGNSSLRVDVDTTQNRPGAAPEDLERTIITPGAPEDAARRDTSRDAPGPEPVGIGIVKDYQLLRVIGRGMTGTVYMACHLTRNQLVALKMMQGVCAAPEYLERFRREARAAQALEHPSIVPVYDIGEKGEDPFFTMALVTGGCLQQAIHQQGPLVPTVAARLLQHVAEAVAYAHDRGIIHRDIKPQNILLQPLPASGPGKEDAPGLRPTEVTPDISSATPMLADFGCARAAAEDSNLTRWGTTMGTPSYMPPEQVLGNLDDIGAHSDLYSLGAVLYCMVTRRPPFRAANVEETYRQVLEEDPVPPRQINPKVPPDLETICLKCLAKVPSHRYARAAQLVEDLGCFLADQPLKHARHIGPLARSFRRFVRFGRQHPVRMANVAMGLIACAVLIILAVRYVQRREATFKNSMAKAKDNEDKADGYKRKGDRPQALAHYEDAVATYKKLKDDYPNRLEVVHHLVDVYTQRGILRVILREYDEAEHELKQAEALAQARPKDPDCQLQLAEVYHNLGILYDARSTLAQQQEALKFYERSLEIRQSLYESDKSKPEYQRDLARGYGYIGDTQLELGLTEEARKSYDKAEFHRRELVDKNPENIDAKCQLARSYGNTGIHYEWTGHPQEAIEAHRERKKYQDSFWHLAIPVQFVTDMAGCQLEVARLLLDEPGLSDEIPRLLDEALRAYEPMLAESKGKADRSFLSLQAQVCVYLGKYYYRTTDLEQARRHLDKARDLLNELLTKPPITPNDQYCDALGLALEIRLSARERGQPEAFLYEGPVLGLLERAVSLGYTNVARLERDLGFEPFRNSQGFKGIARRIREEQDKARSAVRKKSGPDQAAN